MRLKSLIKVLDDCPGLKIDGDFEVKGINCNSREIKPGYLFVAIKGEKENGNKYIKEAITKGARAIVFQGSGFPPAALGTGRGQGPGKTFFMEVKDTRKALAKLAAEFYGHPAEKIKLIGITGTNGKTTVSYLLEAILQANHAHPAVIGTVNYRFKNTVIAAKNTTPGPLELQSLFFRMRKAGIDYAVMEVSSHALAQGRTAGLNFHSAIFTNLTQDHLDYHSSMESYFQAKKLLFENSGPACLKIVNNDDPFGRRLKEQIGRTAVTYGIENKSDYMAQKIKLGVSGSEFLFVSSAHKDKIKMRLIGRHNVLNALAALCWASEEGISLQLAKKAIEKFTGVPGRLEKIDSRKDFAVYVDYAHTDDALKNVISSLRQVSSGRLIVVFGCGGERDKTKRPKMGKVVTGLADYAIITSDNPRSEKPGMIIRDILKGVAKENYSIVPERRQAIKKSFSLAGVGDIVLIAGKGHENYQLLKERKIHFDDREVARQCLNALN